VRDPVAERVVQARPTDRAPRAHLPCGSRRLAALGIEHVQVSAAARSPLAPGSENRTGLYLETNGIHEMVRNYIKNSDDGRHPYITPLNAESHANLPPAILVTNGFDPLRDVGHAYAQKLAAAGNDLTYVHNPDLTQGFPQFTRYSAACD
jgi:acetyl esterase/lipase